MKLVLSRKSFDSAYGGKSNLIFQNGALLALPIPGFRYVSKIDFNRKKYNPTEYRHIKLPATIQKLLEENSVKGLQNYADLMLRLFESYTGKKITKLKERLRSSYQKPYYCHLDPDLIYESLERLDGWRGLFGPHPKYQRNLRNDVTKNSLILFFGTFKHVIIDKETLRYTKKKDGKDFIHREKHVIYGYLQIQKVITKSNELEAWMHRPYHHPHLDKKLWENENRALYVAKKNLFFGGKKTHLPGYGIFKFNSDLILTEENATKSNWKRSLFPIGSKITHQGKEISKKKWNENGCLKWDSFGQEFIIENNSLFETHIKEKIFKIK